MAGKTTVMRPTLCPYCGYVPDRASHVRENISPKVGDYSICVDCGGIARFGIGFVLVRIPDDEIDKAARGGLIAPRDYFDAKLGSAFVRRRGRIKRDEKPN